MQEQKIRGGFVLLARETLQADVLADGPPLYIKLWAWMLTRANFRDRDKLKRGQFVSSIKEMQAAMSYKKGYATVTPKKEHIRRAYEALARASLIATTKTTRGMIITLLNYEESQDPKSYERHNEGHNEGPTNAPGVPQDTEEGEEEKKGRQGRQGPARGRRSVDPRVKKVTDFWNAKYAARYGRGYIFDQDRDTKMVRKALRVLDEHALCDRVELFFETEDPWILGAGHTIGVFYSTLNKPLGRPVSRPAGPDPDVAERRTWRKDKEQNPHEFLDGQTVRAYLTGR